MYNCKWDDKGKQRTRKSCSSFNKDIINADLEMHIFGQGQNKNIIKLSIVVYHNISRFSLI